MLPVSPAHSWHITLLSFQSWLSFSSWRIVNSLWKILDMTAMRCNHFWLGSSSWQGDSILVTEGQTHSWHKLMSHHFVSGENLSHYVCDWEHQVKSHILKSFLLSWVSRKNQWLFRFKKKQLLIPTRSVTVYSLYLTMTKVWVDYSTIHWGSFMKGRRDNVEDDSFCLSCKLWSRPKSPLTATKLTLNLALCEWIQVRRMLYQQSAFITQF